MELKTQSISHISLKLLDSKTFNFKTILSSYINIDFFRKHKFLFESVRKGGCFNLTELYYSDNLDPKIGVILGILVEELVEILVGNKKNTFHLM